MNAILDAYYRGDTATVACVRFSTWNASRPSGATVSELKVSAAYVPGRFFERELPCLLHALKQETVGFDVIVIDGFVHLKPPLTKGLGYYLAESVPYPGAVIGVAKNPLKVADNFLPVLRGKSRLPLFVSAINIEAERAAELIKSMHGEYRIPTLIRVADQLCRGASRGRIETAEEQK